MGKGREKLLPFITHPEIEQYAEAHTTAPSAEMASLVASSDEALRYIDMISGPLVCELLKILIKTTGTHRILEVGTFTGYSALEMAYALPPEGELVTLEMNLKYLDLARKHIGSSPVADKITIIEGNAVDTMPKVDGIFDLVFIDADKRNYLFYYETALQKLRKNGLIVADNVLWGATVLHPEDEKAKSMVEFNRVVSEDKRVEKVMLPVRDGLFVIRKC